MHAYTDILPSAPKRMLSPSRPRSVGSIVFVITRTIVVTAPAYVISIVVVVVIIITVVGRSGAKTGSFGACAGVGGCGGGVRVGRCGGGVYRREGGGGGRVWVGCVDGVGTPTFEIWVCEVIIVCSRGVGGGDMSELGGGRSSGGMAGGVGSWVCS